MVIQTPTEALSDENVKSFAMMIIKYCVPLSSHKFAKWAIFTKLYNCLG